MFVLMHIFNMFRIVIIDLVLYSVCSTYLIIKYCDGLIQRRTLSKHFL